MKMSRAVFCRIVVDKVMDRLEAANKTFSRKQFISDMSAENMTKLMVVTVLDAMELYEQERKK